MLCWHLILTYKICNWSSQHISMMTKTFKNGFNNHFHEQSVWWDFCRISVWKVFNIDWYQLSVILGHDTLFIRLPWNYEAAFKVLFTTKLSKNLSPYIIDSLIGHTFIQHSKISHQTLCFHALQLCRFSKTSRVFSLSL